jgi:RND family efflux transporter MFP subunit
MKNSAGRIIATVVLAALVLAIGWGLYNRLTEDKPGQRRGGSGPAPVAVVPIEVGPITLRRTFSGTLESPNRFVAAAKVAGRIERLLVDVSDTVERGQVVAELDSDEYEQAVAQAEAEVAVAKANRAEADNALEIANRNLDRIATLRTRGVASDSQEDTAKAEQLRREADVKVAQAQVTRAEAALASARIRLSYTKVAVSWTGGDDQRIVAERFADEGDTLSANSPIVSIVELDPIQGIVFVTERDYGRLSVGQTVELRADAYPGETFTATIDRIAPIFRETSRQARIELRAANADRRLKPGMFIRATVELAKIDDATIVPNEALARRGDVVGVFLVNEADMTVRWQPVTVGIREGNRVQITGEGLSGRVVTLGQQMVDDGSKITIPDDAPTPEAVAE